MGRLIDIGIASLDGYIEDPDGSFDWYTPDEEVHAFVNQIQARVGTCLIGRLNYELMEYWDTDQPDWGPVEREFAEAWRSADKIVYSTTRSEAGPRARVERTFDADAIRTLKASSERDLAVSGPNLAAHAIAAGLVDEYHLFLTPFTLGGGKPFFPAGQRLSIIELVDERRFEGGVVYLRYAAV